MNVILDGIDISGGVESGNFWSEEALGWYGYLSLRHLRPLPPSEPATATSRAIYEAHDVALRAIGRTVPIELARAAALAPRQAGWTGVPS